jgi:peptidyl-prolyl cis-trans isomerase SurA
VTSAIAPQAKGRPLFPQGRRIVAATLALGYLLLGGTGHATVVERIVAVVGDRPILMSDLRFRSRPYLNRIQQELPTESHRAAATTQLHKQLIQQLVDEELIARAARRAKIVISEEDITAALERVAKQNNITMARLLEEAASSGMTELQYREELRRQIVEARMLNLRVQGRVRVRDEDLRAMYLALVHEERKKLSFEAAWIVLDGRSEGAAERAELVSSRARSGEPFPALVGQYSIDGATKQHGGALGSLVPGKLPPQLDRIAQRLEVGEVSSPIRLGDRLVILRLLSRAESQLPTFDEARGELGERVYGEKMAKARRRWLEGLRGQTHVEVRL